MHKKKVCTYAKFLEKKIVFSEKKNFATGLIFERFLAPRSRFFEKVNGLGVLRYQHNVALTTYFRLMVSSPKTRIRVRRYGLGYVGFGGMAPTLSFSVSSRSLTGDPLLPSQLSPVIPTIATNFAFPK
ncbi:hypothetical protein LXL04_004472 [Taraxacum kok-saghyz]